MPQNVTPLFPAATSATMTPRSQWFSDVLLLRDRIRCLRRDDNGRIFRGTDVPLRMCILDDTRPSGIPRDLMANLLGVKSTNVTYWLGRRDEGVLVDGMKVTQL